MTPIPATLPNVDVRELSEVTGWGRGTIASVTGIPEDSVKDMLRGKRKQKPQHLRQFGFAAIQANVLDLIEELRASYRIA